MSAKQFEIVSLFGETCKLNAKCHFIQISQCMSFNHSAYETVLDMLEVIYLRLRKIVSVTVVKFEVDNRGSDGTGCFRIKVRTDTTEFTGMRIEGLRKR